ncbi:hypothetical protein ACOMHN_045073 [Nucella lapillus]
MEHVVRLIEDTKKWSLKGKNKKTVATFFDIKKAFDSVWHAKLLNKMGALGITGRMYNFIQTFLDSREITVKRAAGETQISGQDTELLERYGFWDKTRKLLKRPDNKVLIPIIITTDLTLPHHHLPEPKDVLDIVIQVDLPPSKAERIVTPAQKLLAAVGQMLDRCDSSSSSSRGRFLMEEVPNHWEKHGDLVLLPVSSFSSAEWDLLGRELWQTVAECTGSSRVAHQSIVSADGFRTPQVTLQLGDNALVQHIDNAITYEYDLTRCMFSAGNISEKLRIAGFSCAGETVVDLYAGIGYFTLPYLVHAGATHVHACEWNPDAVAALRRNLKLNCVHTRCTVHPGDNQQLTLRGVANRVNLGLIPSSEEGWSVACRVLKPTGGILHIHGNVNTQTSLGERHPERTDSERTHSLPPERTDSAWQKWGEGVCRTLESLLEKEHGGCWRACVLHIENVKSYAPHINHLVLDVRCTPDNPP